MTGFVSNEQDQDLMKILGNSKNALQFLARSLPKHNDRIFFSNDSCWVEIRNRNGRLHLEIGEGAA